MKALVKPKPQIYKAWPVGLELVDKPIPEPREKDDVQLRVIAAGICGTDVGIYHSKDSLKQSMSTMTGPNVTIGHEFCGRVNDAGPAARLQLARQVVRKAEGDPVIRRFTKGRTPAQLVKDKGFLMYLGENFIATAEMHITCGHCAQCRLGDFHVCTNTVIRGLHDDGAFAEYVVLPAGNILLFRNGEIPEEIVAFMDAIGNATHTVQSLSAIKGKSVAVLGAGVIGLMSVAIARSAGAKTVLVTDASHGNNTHEKLTHHRFKMARALGADECFDVSIAEEKKCFY